MAKICRGCGVVFKCFEIKVSDSKHKIPLKYIDEDEHRCICTHFIKDGTLCEVIK